MVRKKVKVKLSQGVKLVTEETSLSDQSLFGTVHRLFSTVLADNVTSCYSNTKHTITHQRLAEQLMSDISDKKSLVDLVVVVLRMLKQQESNIEDANETLLIIKDQFKELSSSFSLLNLTMKQLNKPFEWDPRSSPRYQSTNHQNTSSPQKSTSLNEPVSPQKLASLQKPLVGQFSNQLDSYLVSPQEKPKSKWPPGGPFKIEKIMRTLSPVLKAKKMSDLLYKAVSPQSTAKRTSIEKINISAREKSRRRAKPVEVSKFESCVNLNHKLKNNKIVRAIKMLVKKRMTENQLEELGDHILNPDKNLPIIKRFLVDGDWNTYTLDDLLLLLFKSENIGFYLSFKPVEKDWTYVKKLIKN